MERITVGPYRLTCVITHSRRRTVRLRVAAVDRVEVAAPLGFSRAEVEGLLRTKEAWIVKQLARLAEVAASPLNAAAEAGAQLLFLGRPRTLTMLIGPASRAEVRLEDDRLFASLPPLPEPDRTAALEHVLRRWYGNAARQVLSEKTAHWAGVLGVRPQRIFIREQKSRWGSCSSHGNISYNWRVVMAPPEVVDYLVIHELCHLKAPNHSPAFWALVAAADPAYKEHRRWLRRHGALLTRLFSGGN